MTDAIASGLKAEGMHLSDAAAIVIPPSKRNNRDWPTHFVAAAMLADGTWEVGLWAIGDYGDHSVGPIIALNGPARTRSSWGEAAQPGSQADQVRLHLLGYLEAERAVAAAG